MRERLSSDRRIGLGKNTALEIVAWNRFHFSRELRRLGSRSGPTYRAILPVLWRHPEPLRPLGTGRENFGRAYDALTRRSGISAEIE